MSVYICMYNVYTWITILYDSYGFKTGNKHLQHECLLNGNNSNAQKCVLNCSWMKIERNFMEELITEFNIDFLELVIIIIILNSLMVKVHLVLGQIFEFCSGLIFLMLLHMYVQKFIHPNISTCIPAISLQKNI